MAGAAYGSLPFAEQIAFFRRKLGNLVLTNAWTDIQKEGHDHGFMVAGANRADLLKDFAEAVDRVIADGGTLAQFRKDFDRIVAKHGWDYNGGRNWRSRVIYETNLRTSYAAGRYEQLQAVKRARPYWQYDHSEAVQHPRPHHQAWNNLVLHADDPWWKTHYPPNGWGCQCSVRSLSERDLKRMGKTGPDQAPPVDMVTRLIGQRSPGGPREVRTPAGIDPGFGYAPGRDAWLREQLSRQLQKANAPIDNSGWKGLLDQGPADYNRPALLPTFPQPSSPIPAPATAEDMLDAVRTAIGGDQTLFDVKGLPIGIDAAWLSGHIDKDLQRGRFLPWLADLLADPYEVWMQLERHEVTGTYRLRAQIMKVYDLGNGRALMLVADQADGVLRGWTFLNSRDLSYVDRKRRGLLWWGAP